MTLAVDVVENTDEPRSGQFTVEGRRAALAGALPMLGVYFSLGHASTDYDGAAGAGAADEADPALPGLRLRVAIASGRKLLEILAEAQREATFRYESVRAEQTGHLSGVLDINRWVTRPHGGGGDISFPVIDVARGVNTPENILGAYAGLWVVRELRHAATRAAAAVNSTDYHVARSLARRIERDLQRAPFGGVEKAARAVRTSAGVTQLVSTVRRRVRRREVANPLPFVRLADWVASNLSGEPVLSAGDLDVAAYDETFDPKLFELWCLRQLAIRLSVALNVPEPKVRLRRRGTPVFEFAMFAGTVRVYFQTSITRIDAARSARWHTSDGAPLGGIPDIVVAVTPRGAESMRLVVVDPKLRRRHRPPAEELYKILGYFENFEVHPPRGALLTYTTSTVAPAPVAFEDKAHGQLVWAALNPAADEDASDATFDAVVNVVLDALGFEPPLGGSATDEESTIGAVQAALATWAAGHSADIAPSLERMRTLIGEDCWKKLHAEERTMLATADTLGHQLDSAGDFSGPVIGLCAALEHLLHRVTFAQAFTEAELQAPAQRYFKTFGGQIRGIREASGENLASSPQLSAHIAAEGFAAADLLALCLPTGDLSILNTRWRIPAAHRDVMTQREWRAAYSMVVGSGQLLVRTVGALTTATP
ncbi:hypothetical protein [Microbacterium sp. Mcb102]|uniref:hypothetical protein n=1 Tax=Microbacterium sp. Mcb102 TaxID=2926012 RepID=UPI0021C9AC44|nr:hypothetical protein [Microbacterium sp. Mcb102]